MLATQSVLGKEDTVRSPSGVVWEDASQSIDSVETPAMKQGAGYSQSKKIREDASAELLSMMARLCTKFNSVMETVNSKMDGFIGDVMEMMWDVKNL